MINLHALICIDVSVEPLYVVGMVELVLENTSSLHNFIVMVCALCMCMMVQLCFPLLILDVKRVFLSMCLFYKFHI